MDYYSAQINFPQIEDYPLDFDWLYYDQQPFENLLLDFPPLQSTILEPNLLPLWSRNYGHQLPCIDFQDFEDFGGVFSLEIDNAFTYPNCEDTMVDRKPQTNLVTSFHHYNHHHDMINNPSSTDQLCSEVVPQMTFERKIIGSTKSGKIRNYGKFSELESEDIQKYFDLPIKEAAKELGVGVTRLKKRCRELNITRWPHRKFKSLKYLISNVKKMGLDGNEIRMLEEHKRLLEEVPDMELTEKTKKLRQACFKANYKNKRSLARV